MLQTRRSWTWAYCLAVCLAFATAQNCQVTWKDAILTEDQWRFGITLDAIADTSSPGTQIESLLVTSVLSATVVEEKYLNADSATAPGEVRILLTPQFALFEEQEEASALSSDLEFTCADSLKRILPILVPLTFSNNFDPRFENQNSEDGRGYVFDLPMPFPRGVSITAAYNPIFAYDVDIGNTMIAFSLEDPSGLFEVEYEKGDTSPLKTRHYVTLRAASRLELTEGLDLTIIATDNEGTTRSARAPIRINVDAENSDPLTVPSAFGSLLYTSQLSEAQPPGPITTIPTPITVLDFPAGDVVVELLDAPGETPWIEGLFTVTLAPGTNEVTLSLARALTPADLVYEVLVMVLKATSAGNPEVTAETIVHVDLPSSEFDGSSFDSLLYTAAITGLETGPITTNPTPIIINNAPAGDIDVEVQQAPGGGVWIAGLFSAAYTEATNTVVLSLNRVLTAEELDNEALTVKLTASQGGSTLAETIVSVDLPTVVDPPPLDGSSFSSLLYTAAITGLQTGPITTVPTPITIEDPPAGAIDVAVEQAPGEGVWIADLFSAAYTEATNTVVLSLNRVLTAEELNNEALIVKLKASQGGSTLAETIVSVDLPTVVDPPPLDVSSFSSLLYTAAITGLQTGPITTNPTPVTIENAPAGNIDVAVEQAPGGGVWIAGLFSATYTEATNMVVLSLTRVLTAEELNNEALIVKLRASQGGSTLAETIVSVDLPTVVDPPPLTGSSFSSLLYTAAITGLQTGPITTNPTPVTIENAPAGSIDVAVEQAPGGGVWIAGLFSATYTEATNTVVLSLTRVLTAEELNNEALIVKLRASQGGSTLAETIVSVDLPTVVDPPPLDGSSFSSLLYTAAITGLQTGPITTNPTPVTIENAPAGNIDVAVEQAPGGGVWIAGLFSAAYTEATNTVVLSLTRVLTAEELNNEALIVKLTASQGGSTVAETIVSVDLPTVVDPPPLDVSSFSSLLYTAVTTGLQTGPITTVPTPISIQNAPAGTIDVLVEQAPGEGVWIAGLFSAAYTEATNTVVLSLNRVLTAEELNNEVLIVKLRASQGGSTLAETIVSVDLPTVVDPPPLDGSSFSSLLYTAAITGLQTGPITTVPTPISIENAPAGTIDVVVEQAPGEGVWIAGLFSAAYTDATNTVVLSLNRVLTAEELNNEVLIVKLRASLNDATVSETIVHLDLPAIFAALPGTFESPLYTAVISNPEMPPGLITTHTTITITDPPAGTIDVELVAAPGGAPSHEEFFSAEYKGSGVVEIRLTTSLSEEVLENEVLVMQLRATQASNPDFSGDTIIHIDLPATECPLCTTLFPTEPPTCAPCLCTTTTPAPPLTIQHEHDPYLGSLDAGERGVVFTVRATYNGAADDFYYDFLTSNEALRSTLIIDHVTGDLSLVLDLAPGLYRFQVTARHEASGDERPAAAILEIRSVAECEDGVTCFPLALMTLEIPEATANDNIIPGAAPSSCVYSFYDQKPETGWFTIVPTTGQVGVTAEADCEDEMFSGLPRAEVLLRMQVVCGRGASLLTNVSAPDVRANEAVTRQQMLVLVTLNNVNEFDPAFPATTFAVAYPKQDLARQILPGPITVVQATDKDVGESEGLRYALQNVNPKFSVHPETGYLYPVDGTFDYRDASVNILANDAGGKNGRTTVQIRHVDEDHIAVLAVSDAVLEDVAEVLERLNTELPHEWGALKAAVVAEDASSVAASSALRNRLRRAANRAERSGGLFLVVYALDESNKQPKPYSELKTQLESLEPGSSGWLITLVQSWEDAGSGTGTPGGGGEEVNAALEAATITLGVLVGLLLIAIAVILYITVFRRKQQDKMAAKTGFKNRTSFSKESGAAANGKRNSLSPEWGSENKSAEDPDDRRKSMVTFSDEPEVIPPLESARL